MKKNPKLLSAGFSILTFAAAFFMVTIPALAASFADVPENSEHYAAIEYLKAKGVVSGYPDGTFQPEKNINRAETLKILLLGTGTTLESTQSIVFPDVQTSDWFYTYVRKAFELKIVEGYPDGNFKPENTINLAESLKVILLSFKAELPAAVNADPYPDVAKDIWYASYAQYSKDKVIVEPLDEGSLHGERQMTRAEFAEIVYRLMYIRENSLSAFPLSTNWPVFEHPTDHYSVKYPFSWIKIQAGNHMIFWKQDQGNGQTSFARIFPNSATVYMVVDPNQTGLGLEAYMAKLQYDASAVIQKDTINTYPFASVVIFASGLQDFYLQLPNKTILIVYTQMGNGPLRPLMDQQIRFIIGTVRYIENAGGSVTGTSGSADFLSEVRKNLLVAGKGKSFLDQMEDALVIETDTIGIGTGPVDYYFSAVYNVTIKYERDSDTMLAMKDGRTTAF
jgi:hypothetical protein